MTNKKKPAPTTKSRKEFALAFAQLTYDIFKDKQRSAKVINGQNDAQSKPNN